MAIVGFLLLPLPYKVRKSIVKFCFMLWNLIQVRITIFIASLLIGLFFIDSAQRSFKHPVSLGQPGPGSNGDHHHNHGYSDLSSSEYLAKKFYNQRNFYITGIVLYLGLAIPSIVILLSKITKWNETLMASDGKKPTGSATELEAELKNKEASVVALKKQIENLQKAYNKKADESIPLDDLSKTDKKEI